MWFSASFALEDKAARETFADPGQARRWLAENARQLAPCLGLEKSADGSLVLRRRPRAIAARSANAGYQLILCDTLGRDPVTVVPDYRSRDRAEKALRPAQERGRVWRGPRRG